MKMPNSVKLLLCVSLAVLLQFSAFAHTGLKESSPGDGATVKTPPAHLNLVFTAPVRLIKLELMGVGHEMPTKFEPGSEAMAAYSIETSGMHPGEFTVNWAVIGDDGHTVTNSYSFVVDPDAPEHHAGAHAEEHHAGAHAEQDHGAADHH
jgi:methionine-rich copper-binding protein CopC